MVEMMKDEKRRAGNAHEMVMLNLAMFHLLLPVAALSSGYVSILLSLALNRFGSNDLLGRLLST